MGDFSGIDPQAMLGMIKSYTSDKNQLRARMSAYKSDFARLGLDTAPFNELLGICGWLDDQLPMLQRRQGLAAGLDHDPTTLHMVNIAEPVITSAAAQADGKALADQFNQNTSGDQKAADAYHRMAQELAAHQDDPDYCSAFYANLTPAATTVLPSLLASTGSKTANADLRVFSHAFGTAVSAAAPAPGFDKVENLYLQPVPKGDYPAGWDRGAMLLYGDFPSDFLAKATRANVLDQFAGDQDQDFRGVMSDASILGLPQDTVALNLQALSTDSRAAFDAVAQMGDPSKPDLRGHLDQLMTYGRFNEDVQTSLGQMIDTASGVHGTEDANGQWTIDPSYKPNPYEQTFAFEAMLATGHTKETLEFNGLYKEDMGRLAAAYAPEMLTGGHNVDENSGDSSFGRPVPYDPIPGVDPRFYLSPEDTYLFMKTFADDDSKTAPFDEAMGKLQHDVLTASAKFDADAIAAGRQDPRTFDFAAKAFGNTQRLEYQAEKQIRGEMDEAEEAFREHLKMVGIGVAELVGEPELPGAWTLAWRAGSFAVKEFGGSAYVESGPDRVEELDEQNFEMVVQARYTMASALVDGGWQTTPIPEGLKGEDGRLKSFEELAKDDQLDEFNTWVNEQREGAVPFHTKQVLSAGELSNQDADVYAQKAEGGGE